MFRNREHETTILHPRAKCWGQGKRLQLSALAQTPQRIYLEVVIELLIFVLCLLLQCFQEIVHDEANLLLFA